MASRAKLKEAKLRLEVQALNLQKASEIATKALEERERQISELPLPVRNAVVGPDDMRKRLGLEEGEA